MTTLDDLLQWLRLDLKAVLTGIRWAWPLGYGQAGRGLDSPRGASLAKSESEQAKGPVYDLGIGDNAARAALHNVANRLVRAELVLNGAWVACGRTRNVITTLSHIEVGATRTLDDVERSLMVLDTLLDCIETDHEHVSDALVRRRVFRATGRAYDEVRYAVGGLERALNRGEESEPSSKECVNGGCKNVADVRELVSGRAGMREGGLCGSSARFRRRNGFLPTGHRLYRELDRQPWDMQNKRRANGMDNGDESLSWALKVVE